MTAAATIVAATGAERFAVEQTAIGPQSLVAGVIPITPRDRLATRAAAPLLPVKPQRPCDRPALSACRAGSRRGLFDLAARNQLDLFQRRDL